MSTQTPDAAHFGYALERVGVIMTPDPSDPHQAEGVLNPGTAWGSDGRLYLYPRVVAAGNISRVGRAPIHFTDGVPTGIGDLEIVLAPDRGWERGTNHGGVEDPRITHIPALDSHVMSYVAFGPMGPRPALAVSTDGQVWTRLGPIQFGYDDALDTDLNLFPNKDVVFFPEPVPGPDGEPAIAMLHRPMYDFSFVREGETPPLPAGSTDDRQSIWISYIPLNQAQADLSELTRPVGHRFVAGPQFDWEALKVGSGPSPIRVEEGWLLLYHGVLGSLVGGAFVPQGGVRYVASAMILDPADPSRVLSRCSEPLLEPLTGHETTGTVNNVVFPTAIETVGDQRYVFYGMADRAIGVARLVRR